jgi:DNA sulfur modification protein DndB
VNISSKNIASSNHEAFTSIIELYQCNKIIFNYITSIQGLKKKEKEMLLLYRPDESTLENYVKQINEFWDAMRYGIPSLKLYVETSESELSKLGNRNENGGNLLFRPISLTQFIEALCEYMKLKKCDIVTAVDKFNKIPLDIQKEPWLNVLWTQDNKINGRIRKKEVKNMMLYCVDKNLVDDKSKNSILEYWAASYGKDLISEKDLLRWTE